MEELAAPAERGMSITVLGSGGPFVNPTRASSGVVVWLDRRAVLLVDAGGGTFERLGRAGVDVRTLEAVLLTHTHIDHSGGLAPVVFGMAMAEREWPLAVAGPTGRGQHPGCVRFCDLLFGPDGAWSYLHTFPGFALAPMEAPSDAADPSAATTLLSGSGLTVRSVAVPHGMMPAVAFRIDAAGRSLVISGDVDGQHPPLAALARDADLLVHDMALPERDVPHGDLHAKPSTVGRMAAAAGVRALLLTHVMPELEDEQAAAEETIRAEYDGTVRWASDLLTVEVGGAG